MDFSTLISKAGPEGNLFSLLGVDGGPARGFLVTSDNGVLSEVICDDEALVWRRQAAPRLTVGAALNLVSPSRTALLN